MSLMQQQQQPHSHHNSSQLQLSGIPGLLTHASIPHPSGAGGHTIQLPTNSNSSNSSSTYWQRQQQRPQSDASDEDDDVDDEDFISDQEIEAENEDGGSDISVVSWRRPQDQEQALDLKTTGTKGRPTSAQRSD